MRKWKKCLLLAAGMAAALSTAAMASQDKSDMVTVEVKNCKGGAIQVECQYPDDMDVDSVYLPIGEKVEVPKGSTLYVEAYYIGYYSEEMDASVDSYPKTVHIVENGKDTVTPMDEYGIGNICVDWEVQGNCTIDADYVAEVDAQGVGEDWDAIPDEDRGYLVYAKQAYYDSPSVVNVDLTARLGSKTVPVMDVPYLRIDSTNKYDDVEWYQDNFEITSTGICSKEILPLGRYKIPIMYSSKKDNGRIRKRYVTVCIGKMARAEVALAEYEEDGEMQTIGEVGGSALNPNADPDADKKQQRYFDASKTKISDVMKLFEEQQNYDNMIVGYKHTGEYVDTNNKTIDKNDARSLSVVAKGKPAFTVVPVLKNGNKTYKTVQIKMIPDSQRIIKYSDSWVEKDGKLYYYVDTYGEDYKWHGNKLASGEWVKRGRQDVYCDKSGALVTNGIAGTKIDDDMGLWLVNAKGYKRTDYTGTWKVGMNEYTIDHGKVTEVKIVEVAAPSSAETVKTFTDGLELIVNNDAATEVQKANFANQLVSGINNLTVAQKNTLHDDVIAKADEALTAVYKDVETGVEKTETEEFEETEQLGEVSAKGLLAAAGLTSEHGADSVKLQIAQTASNALMKFDAKLYVGDDENPTQLKSPVIMEIELPEDVQRMYSKYGYTYKLVHTGEDGTKDIVSDGQTKNGLSLELSADMKTAKIRTNSFSTFELQATRNNNNIINTPDDSTTPVTPSKPSNGNNSGNSGNSSNSSYSDNDDSDDSGTQNTTYRRKKTDAAGQWVQDAKGWWYRRADGSWPKSQWIELGWNGVNSWYYFNESGYMVTGWKEDGGYTYYLNPVSDGTSGQMFTGWHQIDSIWYYFNTLTGGPQGSLVKNAVTPDGYKVGADGAWIH